MAASDPKPPMDPDLKVALQAVPFPAISRITPEVISIMRTATATPSSFLDAQKALGITHREVRIPSWDNTSHQITLSILQRDSRSSKPRPCIFWCHGGGMHWGDRLHTLEFPIDLIKQCDAVCVTVEYRLAPEARFSTSVEDCYLGLTWTSDHAHELDFDAKRLMVGGTSAGGLLAASTVLSCRDRQGPKICAQCLICPALDDRLITVSSRQFLEGYDFLPRGVMGDMWKSTLGPNDEGKTAKIVPPGRVQDLSGLPTTYLDAGSAEVLRDETVAYASKLWAHGVQAELHIWAGGFHGFDIFCPDAAVARASREVKVSWARRTFGSDRV